MSDAVRDDVQRRTLACRGTMISKGGKKQFLAAAIHGRHAMYKATLRILSRASLRGRSMGVMVCAAFGALWASSAIAIWWPAAGNAGYALVALITGVLLWIAIGMLRRSWYLTAANDPALAVRRSTTRRFLGIFAAEIIAINIAAYALGTHHAVQYLMPIIAIVVGLHFYPLATLFHVPHYHVTATVMTLAGLLGVVVIASSGPAHATNAFVDAICAATLWVTGVFSWRSTLDANGHDRSLTLP
ncbi:MAG: hypothetical protein ABI870_15595 [Rhodanobacter sp.]